ncbi:MAG: CshA/CshB family fibrillar adhesin-related protein [Pacificimonas sp.]
MRLRSPLTVALLAVVALLFGVIDASPVRAAVCAPATSAGTAPPSWQTYCWLDFTSYDDAAARSGTGQPFSFDLSDGSQLTFTLKAASSAATAANARTAPSWSGAAVGNSAFLGIPGRPILYMRNSGSTVSFRFENIAIVPPPGVASVSDYAFVVADGESTDNAEYLEFTTNGSPWAILDDVPPISGTQMPVLTGENTATLNMAGGGQTGRVGAYIAGSNSPTLVTAEMDGAGLQGMMFAVRFASITLDKVITGARIDANDQFRFRITSTSSGQLLAEGTTSGTGNGPFDAAVISTASGIPITLSEAMAPGSASPLASYIPTLTCTNSTTGSSTVLPTNLETTSYDFGALAFGDAVTCRFTNTARPHVSVEKQLGPSGRMFEGDQFRLRLRRGGSLLAATTTTGSGAAIADGLIPPTALDPALTYRIDERPAGGTDLSRYTASLSCTNAFGASSSSLPTTLNGNFQLAPGDVVSCVILNTRVPPNALIDIDKRVQIRRDPLNATTNAKAIPGATVRYNLVVINRGDVAVGADTLDIVDLLPPHLAFDGTQPVQFLNGGGGNASGLDPFDASTMVSFSSQPGGGAPYNYTPSNSGPDAAETGIRVQPTGVFAAASGTDRPRFTIRFQAIVK